MVQAEVPVHGDVGRPDRLGLGDHALLHQVQRLLSRWHVMRVELAPLEVGEL